LDHKVNGIKGVYIQKDTVNDENLYAEIKAKYKPDQTQKAREILIKGRRVRAGVLYTFSNFDFIKGIYKQYYVASNGQVDVKNKNQRVTILKFLELIKQSPE
jgi:hypothetical protein